MPAENKRIAKNTLALYVRSLVMMAVSLYTSRVTLSALGISDYGLYSVVGGVIVMFAFLNRSLSSAVQRFLNFGKDTDSLERQKLIFGTSLYLYLVLAGIILVLGETVGLWFLNFKLNIDPARMPAANWVFQCSVLSFCLSLVCVPYNSALVANEKMAAFAWISLLEAFLKLAVAIALPVLPGDRLKWFAVLLLLNGWIVRSVYVSYARRHFPECRTNPAKDPQLLRELTSFSSWVLLSNLSIILRTHGMAIVFNLFFGTVVNAALGIANQVNSAVLNFSSNFTTAMSPQLTKRYAAGDLDSMRSLMLSGSRFSYFLLFLLALPVILEAPAILSVWLKIVPDHTATFVRIILIQALIDSCASIMATAQAATGRIKIYQITVSLMGLLNLPLSYLLLKIHPNPTLPLAVATGIALIIGVTRVLFIRRSIGLSLRAFVSKVVLPCSLVTVVSIMPSWAIGRFFPADSLIKSFTVCFSAGILVTLSVLLFGLTPSERTLLWDHLKRKFRLLSGKAAHP